MLSVRLTTINNSPVVEEELASISQNMHWSNQRRFKKGKFSVSTKRFLSYDKDREGNQIINEEQAAIVRRIFKDYLSGLGAFRIAPSQIRKDPNLCERLTNKK